MTVNAIVAPSLLVNGEALDIVPNSAVVVKGTGEKDVKTQSAGGNRVENVIFDNVETRVGQIKYKIYNTKKNLDILDSFVGTGAAIDVVQFVTPEGYNGSMTGAIVVNDPERTLGMDGETEVHFKGGPIV